MGKSHNPEEIETRDEDSLALTDLWDDLKTIIPSENKEKNEENIKKFLNIVSLEVSKKVRRVWCAPIPPSTNFK